MALDSKEIRSILITILIGIPAIIISLNIKSLSPLLSWATLIILGVVIIILIFRVIYKRIEEIDEALNQQEIQSGEIKRDIEEKLKRNEQLIDIRVDIKDLQRRIEKVEDDKKNRHK